MEEILYCSFLLSEERGLEKLDLIDDGMDRLLFLSIFHSFLFLTKKPIGVIPN